ncbi:conserved Plasmodium protein, unknown function [Plasmodium ovale curtisi]|nr:conserved Plasmodium protein, unknown function [Plasmodium ovale curtisi]SBS98424.1 conserved Plasmodium protein, unknown function [Plasmodium ovale curtisi]
MLKSVSIGRKEYRYSSHLKKTDKNTQFYRIKANILLFLGNNHIDNKNFCNEYKNKLRKNGKLKRKMRIYFHHINNMANEQWKKKKKKKKFYIGYNLASTTKKKNYEQARKRRRMRRQLNFDDEVVQEPLDQELHESLGGCIENDIKNNYFDTLLGCSEDDYNYDEDNFEKNDLSEETKRKKYYAYGRQFEDKDFNSEHVSRYYKHLPIYYDTNNEGSGKNFRKMYEANKIENLERNIREEDLYYPSVPIKWKVYVCLFFDKKYNYENDKEKKIYDRFNSNIRHKYVLEFLSWVKLSTRIYQNTSKMLMLFNLKRNSNIYGNVLFFTSLNLHYANMFMKSNPYIKLGLCEELYLYSYESNNDHFLIGNFPNLFLQKNYLLLKFFNTDKLKDINGLYEKHMRFYITSNMVFKLGFLKKVPKDNLKDLFMSTYQYLPMTEDQTRRIMDKFDKEFEVLDRCTSVEVGSDCKIRSVQHGSGCGDHGERGESGNYVDYEEHAGDAEEKEEEEEEEEKGAYEKYNSNCVAELCIVNCKNEEEAQEFLEKDPYTRCCFFDSVFLSEVREVAPHIQYSEGYMPKMKSKLNYKYEIDTNLNPTHNLEDKPDFLENRSLAQKKLENHERVYFDILDMYIKLKYTNRDVLCGEYDSGTQSNVPQIIAAQSGVAKDGAFAQKDQMRIMQHVGGGGGSRYRVKIVDYDNDDIDYICNVERNKILYINKKGREKHAMSETVTEPVAKTGESGFNWARDVYDVLNADRKNPNINKEKDIILIDNTLQFFDHIFFKDYLSEFVYISLPPGEFIEDAYAIKDEKNYDFTIFNTSLATQDDFLRRQNFQPRFLKGIWLPKKHSKILFYDKQNNALLFGTGVDKTFSWDKKVPHRIMKRALINMEIAIEKIRKGSSIIHDDITIRQETERTIKEYAPDQVSLERRFSSPFTQMGTSEGYPDLKPPPGLEYLNPYVWEKTTDEHKELMLDSDRVQQIHSKFLKKLELYKASIDEDPFIQKVPSESDILSHSDKVDVQIL